MADSNEDGPRLVPTPNFDITDTMKFRLDLWQRVVGLEKKMNGVNPSECQSFTKVNIKLLWAADAALFTALMYVIFG